MSSNLAYFYLFFSFSPDYHKLKYKVPQSLNTKKFNSLDTDFNFFLKAWIYIFSPYIFYLWKYVYFGNC